jgi:hypothetical protein
MLVIPEKRRLIIDTTEPNTITTVIPHARTMQHEGRTLVAVPYGVDESLVLHNLGYSVPAPILHYYSWPGRFAPMDHQRDTAAFCTTHKRALVLNAPGCVDADTEYLSPTGWVRIADYAGGQVAQFSPDTGVAEFVDGEYIKLPCDDMVRVKTKYGIDQLLSPEHRCLVYSKRNQAKYEVMSAAELRRREREHIGKSWSTVAFSQAAVGTTFSFDGPGIALTDAQLRVQVAVIADGYFPTKSTARCFVRVKKERKQNRMRELLAAAAIPYSENPVQPEGFVLFTFYAPWKTKVFDARWWECSAHQLQLVYDEAPHWDGSVPANPNRGWSFSSYQKQSADFVQFACAASGHTARVLVTTRDRRGRVETEYTVQVRPGVTMVGLQGGSSVDVTTTAPSTDGFKYCFTVPSSFLVLRRNGCVFTTGNSGKSISVLWAADHLLEEGIAKRVLIVAPLSTVKVVWGREIKHHFSHRSFVLCTGSRARRMELLKRPGVQYVVINHDGFSTMASELNDFDVVIYDEATALKTPGSRRYKVFAKWMDKYQPWLWMLTGTPISQTPADAWTLARLANSPIVPKSYTTFKDMVMQKVSQFRWIPRPDALVTCQKVLQPSIRFSLDECKDLPQTNFVGRKADMTPQQTKAFKEMQDKAVTVFSHWQVTAANAAVALSKLLQIVTGVIYGDNGTFAIDASERYNVLTELIDEIGDKVIIFVPLRGVQDWLEQALNASGYTVGSVHGDVGTTARNKIFEDFQHTDQPRILLAHPKVAAHGLTLTRAKDIIWYAPIFSLEQYEQANARIRRLTTEGRTSVWHIWSTPFEAELYRRLRTKQATLAAFLELVNGINED